MNIPGKECSYFDKKVRNTQDGTVSFVKNLIFTDNSENCCLRVQ